MSDVLDETEAAILFITWGAEEPHWLEFQATFIWNNFLRKHNVLPITIDNETNQVGLLKHLRDLTNLKLESKLIGTKLRIYPQTAFAYHRIRKYVNENSLESYTYILPEDKKLRLVMTANEHSPHGPPVT
ncbi:hypothetical protein TNCV_4824121 [Trichonephila clavipes]|nr:hypothetical protein TNCV_4824121 [Trichonephila clavipes]